jgi:hypothetical protein
MVTAVTRANVSVRVVNGAKINPSATTVPKSKHAARTAFPNPVLLRPSSSMTA